MQSLWFRAAQTRSLCHCNACVKISTTIARQTTNAIGKLRRVSIGDIFTACYSTILATAAVADSNRKARRREQWDLLISEVKAGSPTDEAEELQNSQVEGNADEIKNRIPGTSGISGIPGSLGNNFPLSRTGINSARAGYTGPMTWDGAGWTSTSSMTRLGTQLNTIPLEITTPVESFVPPETSQDPVPPTSAPPAQSTIPETTANLLIDGERLGEHIPQNSMLKPREPKTRKQLDKLENSISRLVHQLMWTTKLSPIAAEFHSAPPGIFLETERMMERVEQLQQGDITMPAYKLNAEVCEERSYLHDALKALFKNTSPGENKLNLILAKICYNLLISPASPNIFTYNFLIEKFTELMLHDHAQIFVDSFLHDTSFRPTSKTIQVILNHYAAKNDLEGYRSIIKRMRAVDGSMNIARRHVNQLSEPKVLRWAEKHAKRLILREGWLLRKVPRDASIFDILIRTSLQITNTRQSVMYIRAALRQNTEIQPELLCEAVTNCVAQLDYAAGESLLQSILEGWNEEVQKPKLIALTKSTRWAIRELLHLCGIDPSRDLPRVLPVDVPRWNLGRLLFYLNIGSIRDSIDRFIYRIRSLQDVFGIYAKRPKLTDIKNWKAEFGVTRAYDYLPKKLEPHRESSFQSSVDSALEIFDKFSYTEKARAKKSKQGARQARRVMLQSLESKVAFSNANVLSTEMSLVSWYYDQLPRDWRYAYHLRLRQRPYMSLQRRISVLKGLKRLQKLHVLDYQINKSLQQIVLLKKEINEIKREKQRRIVDITAKVNKSSKQIKLLERQIYLLEQRIKSKLQHIRMSGLRELYLLEKEIGRSKRQIELLDGELKLEFPQVNPAKTLRELNLILFKVNKSKHQVKLLAEEISLAFPRVVRKNYINSDRNYYKVLKRFRKELSFRYGPPEDLLLSTEEQEYEVIRAVSVERTLRFNRLEGHISDESILSPISSHSSVPVETTPEASDVS
ncbi:hypothetical protein EYC80_009390 [Monilinia laxa]|uniref:Pentatricopeptide repeat domain-containing protein n=1 Tax=Monilinia laxa TaxID=61186 RepID=A0A5N6JXV7_MONLA|nr:hypothetical protein EYC80_009390 [Monilinia laxa]